MKNSKTVKFEFNMIPSNIEELKNLEEASLDTPHKTCALTMLVLCNYEKDKEKTFEMLDYLKGVEPLSAYEKSFIRDRLEGKGYKVFSFFNGAVPENDYKMSVPYTIEVQEMDTSFPEENWCVLYLKSGGADSVRPIKFRKKPSTGQWFLNQIQCLSDIRIPVSQDKWA